jgi:hypothetical protein
MSDWHVPYAALWRIAGAETVDDLVRLWAELDGPAKLKAFFQRARKFKQSPYGRPWHGVRRVEKRTVRDPELHEAVFALHRRINANPVFKEDHRARMIRDAIVVTLAEITTFDASKP